MATSPGRTPSESPSLSISSATNRASSCSVSATYATICAPGARVGPQPLALAPGVAADHGVGGREDVLRGAVVLLEEDGPGVRVVDLELEDVADGGAAERVDRLVGVTDHRELAARELHVRGVVDDPARRPDQLAHQHVLRVVGVLVLVDQHVPEPAPVVLGDGGEPLQQVHRGHDQVVEVERVRLLEPRLVPRVDLRQHGVELVGRARRPTSPRTSRGPPARP